MTSVRGATAEIGAAAGVLVLAVLVFTVALLPGRGADGAPALLATVPATVLLAVTLQPVHRRLRRGLRRRLSAPVAPVEVLRGLSAGAGEVDLDELPGRMVAVLATAARASRAELWVVVDGEAQPAAWLPPGPPPDGPALGDPALRPITHAGAIVGHLGVWRHDQRSAVETRLLDTYGDRAGLVLAMIARRRGLQDREAELTARVDDLRRSRRRLLEAGRVERRRLERDLHDGAQQSLIALGLSVQLAHRLTTRSPGRAAQVVRDAAELARRTATDLGRLGRALDDPTRSMDDLATALRRATAGASPTVRITVDPDDAGADLPAPVRAAYYYTVLEAIQNAAKHSGAGRVDVHISSDVAGTTVLVRDAGRGLPAGYRAGAGMRSMRRRLAEVGGSLALEGSPGSGTTVRASVPRSAPTPVDGEPSPPATGGPG